MAKIAITDAAFTGLRVVRKNPGAVIAWALFHLASMAAMAWFVLTRFGPVLAQIAAIAQSQGASDPAAAKARLQQLMPVAHQILPLYGYMILYVLALYSIFISAMNRAVLRPRESGLGFLRLGLDELRQLVVMVAYAIMGLLFEILLACVAVLAAFGVAAALRAAAPTAPTVIPVLVGVLVFVIGLLLVEVRLSLASAQTFATRSINLFGSWTLTKGQFWPMVATYLLAFLIYIIVAILAAIVMVLVRMATGGAWGHMAGLPLGAHVDLHVLTMNGQAAGGPFTLMAGKPFDWHKLAQILTPMVVIQLVVNALLTAVLLPILLTPPAAIYKALTAETARPFSPLNMG